MRGRPAPERTVIIDGKPLPEVLDETMIRAVVHGFYERIREDPLLGPVFDSRIAADDWPRHLQRMCDFWSATLLRTARYQGRPLPPHTRLAPSSIPVAMRRWTFANWASDATGPRWAPSSSGEPTARPAQRSAVTPVLAVITAARARGTLVATALVGKLDALAP